MEAETQKKKLKNVLRLISTIINSQHSIHLNSQETDKRIIKKEKEKSVEIRIYTTRNRQRFPYKTERNSDSA